MGLKKGAAAVPPPRPSTFAGRRDKVVSGAAGSPVERLGDAGPMKESKGRKACRIGTESDREEEGESPPGSLRAGEIAGWKEYGTVRSRRLKRFFALAAPAVLSTGMSTRNLEELGYSEWREKRVPELSDFCMVKISFLASLPEGGVERQSGLALLPKFKPGKSPAVSWVVFLKGTEFRRKETPSRRRGPELPFIASLAALGYAVWAPDYAGMGDGQGFQEYCVPDSLANSALEGLQAARSWLRIRGAERGSCCAETGRLAVIGYSEGGTAAMSVLDSLTRGRLAVPGLVLSAAYPMGALLDLRSIEPAHGEEPIVLEHPAFLVYMALGWARAYPDRIRIEDVLSPRVVSEVVPLFDGARSSDRLDVWIARIFKRKRGRVLDADVFSPKYLRRVRESPESDSYARMRDEKRLDRCAPSGFPVILAAAPVDEIVPFSNSEGAEAWARKNAPDSGMEFVKLTGKDHLLAGIEALLYAIVDFDTRETGLKAE